MVIERSACRVAARGAVKPLHYSAKWLMGLVLGVCLAAGSATDATAYDWKTTTDGEPLRWFVSEITFEVGDVAPMGVDSDALPGLFEEAFAEWAKAPCRLPTVTYVGRSMATRPTTPEFVSETTDNVMVVLVGNADWASTMRPNSEIAITLLAHDKVSGQIVDADIAFNAARHTFSTELPTPAGSVDLQSVILHEVGHFFGMDHSSVGDAVMLANYSTGGARRTLTQDDLDGLCALYETVAPCVYDGCDDGDAGTTDVCDPVLDCSFTPDDSDDGGCAAGGSQGPGTLLFAFAVLGLLALPRRRGVA
ncbi:MAG: hypothetical protein ACI9MR_003922 [Myxococcota bacterium]|jgi:uncharacterized protein (TIGR03382 family)